MSTQGSVSGPRSEAEVREALFELQRYLSDEIAPLMVSDSVETLTACPPALTIAAIKSWIGAQMGRSGADATVGDYLFHAIKKLHQIVEYELIEREPMTRYLQGLIRQVPEICPEDERAALIENLQRLGETDAALVGQVEILHRQPGVAAKPSGGVGVAGPSAQSAPAPAELSRGLRRLTVMLDRLGKGAGPSAESSADGGTGDALRGYALATAAVSSRDSEEFKSYLRRLEGMGVEAGLDEVFRTLARRLPGWNVELGEKAGDLPDGPTAQAMRRIVSMAEDPGEGLQRVTKMIGAAVERFNDGALAQAAKMFQLAGQSLEEIHLDPEVAKSLRRKQQDSLSVERLREYADQPERHRLLSRVMGFFPSYTVDGLLDDLAVEERRDQRRLMLSLLEVHGQATRQAALERLEACFGGSVDDPFGYFQRNLLFLLRRIPSPDGEPRDIEVDYFAELSTLDRPGLLVREAIGGLSQFKHPRAEQALIARLSEIETLLSDGGEGPDESVGWLDRIASGLARQGTSAALRALFKHAMSRRPAFGNTMARLEELGGRDLSVDPELLQHVLAALKREVPIKVLGFVVPKNRESILHLVRALAHTPTAEVRAMLEQIAKSYRDQDFAAEARSILSGFDAMALPAAKKESHPGLSGDVDLFGLPNLLQSLADSSVTGTLTLRNRSDEPFSTLVLAGGKIHSCRTGSLEGEPAFYQLFETPTPGTFAFEAAPADASNEPAAPLLDVQSGLLEALRRYDEFQMARALTPDGSALAPTGQKPTAMEGESEVAFLREVWSRASTQVPPEVCEEALGSDSYRVRRLYAHWLETGALRAAHSA